MGGAEAALLALLRKLPKKKFDIDLLVITGQGELLRRVPKKVRVLGKQNPKPVLSRWGRVALYRTATSAMARKGIQNLPYLARNLRQMWKNGRKLQWDKLLWRPLSQYAPQVQDTYDLAVAYIEGASAYYVAERVVARKKAAFIHIDYEMSGYTRTLDEDTYQAFDRIFTVSEEIRGSFLSVHPDCRGKTFIFENIIDQGRIRRLAEKGSSFPKRHLEDFSGTILFSVLRLTPQKCLPVSIRAAKILKDEGIPFRWFVLGDGSDRDTLERLIRSLDLSNEFILMGTRANPYPCYRDCDIYVHASAFEGKSISLQEAKTLGCACLVTDVPGNREQITHEENGLLCELSPESVAEGIKKLLANEPLRKALAKEAEREVIPLPKGYRQLLELV